MTFNKGFIKDKVTLGQDLYSAVKGKDWGQVDHLCQNLAAPGGAVFERLLPLAAQKRIEFIISVRDSANEWEEDGIWHDDGSRPLAFTLGLNLHPENIEGGLLLIRKKGAQVCETITPLPFGEIAIFNTGVDGFEHKVTAVTKGHRVVMAGWCY